MNDFLAMLSSLNGAAFIMNRHVAVFVDSAMARQSNHVLLSRRTRDTQVRMTPVTRTIAKTM